MRLFVHHHTEYHFSEPQARIVQLLRMTPDSHVGQSIVRWRIDVNCDARLKASRDAFGNQVSMLYVQGPIDRIGLTVGGEILTEDRAGQVIGAFEPLPPELFVRSTDLTTPDEAIRALAESVKAEGGSELDQAHRLNTAIHEAITHLPRRTVETRPAASILKAGEGCSLDASHLLLSAARAMGFPARHVSGHLYHDDPDPDHRQAPHFWAELYVPGYEWIGFDPSRDMCPQEAYVRVATGLDYRDTAPISGARTGGGHEILDVGIHVGLTEANAQLQS